MLQTLAIRDMVLIEAAELRFRPGLNVLTGETGSGKSIVVDALGLLFGGRASAEMLRSGSDRARISGIFDAPKSAASILSEVGIDTEDGELLIEREILAGGKSRAFVASRPVTAALLRDLAPLLGDIHGQHDQQEREAEHIADAVRLDRPGGLGFVEMYLVAFAFHRLAPPSGQSTITHATVSG